MENVLSLKNIIEGSNNYYIETYDKNFDVIDIVKVSCMLVQKYGGHLYLGSDPGSLGNPFGLINFVCIYFQNGFVLKYNANDRIFENGVSYFQSILNFRERKANSSNNKKQLFTNFGKKHDYVFFELYNIDYKIGKEEEEFYWYNVNSKIAKAPCCFHSLSLSTLESYAEYISNLNPKEFKLLRKPRENWGVMKDSKNIFMLSSLNRKNRNKSYNSVSAQNLSVSTNSSIEGKSCIGSDLLFNLNEEVIYY